MQLNSTGTAWVQEGWVAGGISGNGYTICTTTAIHLYEEGQNGNASSYTNADIGGLSLNSSYVLRIEYFPNTSGNDCEAHNPNYRGSCWISFYNYNYAEAEYDGFPTSGAPTVAGEVYSPYCGSWSCGSGNAVVEMPTTIFGSSDPSTNNGLRIDGANGYVPWNTSLSSGSTSAYDERNCPNTGNCPHSPAYTVSNFNNYYKVETYGACGSGGC